MGHAKRCLGGGMRTGADRPRADERVPGSAPGRGAARRRSVPVGAVGLQQALPTRRRPAPAVESATVPTAIAAKKTLGDRRRPVDDRSPRAFLSLWGNTWT